MNAFISSSFDPETWSQSSCLPFDRIKNTPVDLRSCVLSKKYGSLCQARSGQCAAPELCGIQCVWETGEGTALAGLRVLDGDALWGMGLSHVTTRMKEVHTLSHEALPWETGLFPGSET